MENKAILVQLLHYLLNLVIIPLFKDDPSTPATKRDKTAKRTVLRNLIHGMFELLVEEDSFAKLTNIKEGQLISEVVQDCSVTVTGYAILLFCFVW